MLFLDWIETLRPVFNTHRVHTSICPYCLGGGGGWSLWKAHRFTHWQLWLVNERMAFPYPSFEHTPVRHSSQASILLHFIFYLTQCHRRFRCRLWMFSSLSLSGDKWIMLLWIIEAFFIDQMYAGSTTGINKVTIPFSEIVYESIFYVQSDLSGLVSGLIIGDQVPAGSKAECSISCHGHRECLAFHFDAAAGGQCTFGVDRLHYTVHIYSESVYQIRKL